MLPQTKEYLAYQKLEETEAASSPWGFNGSMAFPTPSFQTSGLQSYESMHFCCFKPTGL